MNKVTLLLKEESIQYSKDRIKGTADIVTFLNSVEDTDKLAEENVFAICLNNRNEVMAYSLIAKGTLNTCAIDKKTLFKTVLLSNANKFIIVHNHPSGDPTPSTGDISATKILQDSSKLLDIQLLDSIVIGKNGYASCMDRI